MAVKMRCASLKDSRGEYSIVQDTSYISSRFHFLQHLAPTMVNLFKKIWKVSYLLSVMNAKSPLWFSGVTVNGLEFGLGPKGPDDIFNYPGTFNYDFFSPKNVSLGYLESNGVNLFRIAFAWERIMPDLSTNELNSAYVSHLDKAVAYITKNGTAMALLEMHNYGRYYFIGSEAKVSSIIGDGMITKDNFIMSWMAIANHYKNNTLVSFGLMSGGRGFPNNAVEYYQGMLEIITNLRSSGFQHYIFIRGAEANSVKGHKNSANALMPIVEKRFTNIIFEVSQYFNVEAGNYTDCSLADNAEELFGEMTDWLSANELVGFLAEASVNNVCIPALERVLASFSQATSPWIGFAYFASGSAWGDSPGERFLEKSGPGVINGKQLQLITKYRGVGAPRAVSGAPRSSMLSALSMLFAFVMTL